MSRVDTDSDRGPGSGFGLRQRLAAALVVEAHKTMASPVMRGTGLLLVLGVLAVTAALLLGAEQGNPDVLAQLGDLADSEGWARLTGVVTQITAAAALLGFGVALSWMIGREFADGSISGLFALPVSRGTLALAKLLVYLLWTAVVSLALVLGVSVVGIASGYGVPNEAAVRGLLRLCGLGLLSGLLALPAGWAASVWRGLLPGIAVSVGCIVAAQVMVVVGSGAWFPLAAPALWAQGVVPVSALQLLLVPLVAVVVAGFTVSCWQRLQLDR